MRKGIVVAGIVLLVFGLIALAVPFATSSQSAALQPTSSGGAGGLAYSPTSLVSSGTLSVSWSGAASTTTVSVSPCDTSSCTSTSAAIASGTGSSGSFSLSVQPGHYYLISQNGNTEFLVSIQTTGFEFVDVIGIVLIVVGLVLAVLGYRATARARPEAVPEVAPEGEMVRTEDTPLPPPISDPAREAYLLPSSAAGATAENTKTVIPERPNASDTPPPTGPGGRPPIRCSSCGTWNEPWLDSCRWCKRALTSTGK
jgi:uncharacterized membrane protein